MNNKDQIDLLLAIKNEEGLDIPDQILIDILSLHREHQYEKERSTLKQVTTLIEDHLDQLSIENNS